MHTATRTRSPYRSIGSVGAVGAVDLFVLHEHAASLASTHKVEVSVAALGTAAHSGAAVGAQATVLQHN